MIFVVGAFGAGFFNTELNRVKEGTEKNSSVFSLTPFYSV